MSARIGINGFGRMGRLGLRAGRDREELEIVRINEINEWGYVCRMMDIADKLAKNLPE